MTDALLVLGSFLGGCVCTALFAQKLAHALADELHRLGNRLERK